MRDQTNDRTSRIGAVILTQATTTARANPLMWPMAGSTLIEHVIARARRIRNTHDLAVTTTTRAVDDMLDDRCHSLGVAVCRCAPGDSARQIMNYAMSQAWDCFACIDGNTPFLFGSLIESGVRRAIRERADLVTNQHPCTYPQGIAIEVVRTAALRRACQLMKCPSEINIAMEYMCEHPDNFKLVNLRLPMGDHSDIRLRITTRSDLQRQSRLIRQIGGQFAWAGLPETIAAYRAINRVEEATLC